MTNEKKMNQNSKVSQDVQKRYGIPLMNRFMFHGTSYILNKDEPLSRRFLWTLLVIAALTMFLIRLKVLVSAYVLHEVTVDVFHEQSNELMFPAITLCPINQFENEKFSNSSMKKVYQKTGFAGMWRQGKLPESFDIAGDILVKDLNTSSFEMSKLLYDCTLIHQDRYNPFLSARECGPHKFEKTISENFGTCFTLNSGRLEKILSVNHSGLSYGYMLNFDMRTNESFLMHPYNGFRVILHDQGEPPVFNSGFVITSGFHYFIDLERVETFNNHPDDRCVDDKKLDHFSSYNQKACLLEQLTNKVAVDCGCRLAFMPDNGRPYCSLKQIIKCATPITDHFSVYNHRNLCPRQCKEISYDIQMTDSRFLHNPKYGFNSIIYKRYKESGHMKNNRKLELFHNMSLSDFESYVEDNLISVVFYYGDMEKIVNIRKTKYRFESLLGNIGGFLKVMMGATVLTLYRVIELIILFIFFTIKELKSGKQSIENYAMLEMDNDFQSMNNIAENEEDGKL